MTSRSTCSGLLLRLYSLWYSSWSLDFRKVSSSASQKAGCHCVFFVSATVFPPCYYYRRHPRGRQQERLLENPLRPVQNRQGIDLCLFPRLFSIPSRLTSPATDLRRTGILPLRLCLAFGRFRQSSAAEHKTMLYSRPGILPATRWAAAFLNPGDHDSGGLWLASCAVRPAPRVR